MGIPAIFIILDIIGKPIMQDSELYGFVTVAFVLRLVSYVSQRVMFSNNKGEENEQ